MKKNIVQDIVYKWKETDRCINSKIAPIPKILMLELTNACNLSCSMCYNPKMKREKGFMSLDLAEKILDEAREIGLKRVALYTTGESLLHKHFIDIVKLCKERELYSYLTSNGLLLNRKMCYQICESGLDSFKFSIDAVNKFEYEKIRVGGCFEDLIDKLKMLKRIRDEMHSSMSIYASLVLMKYNEDNIGQFRDTFGPYVDSILISCITNQAGGIVDEYERLKGRYQNGVKSAWKSCRQLWDRIVISYDGKISACCVDYDMKMVYFEFKETGLRKAWNNEIIVEWRSAHLKGDVTKLALCRKCNSPYLQQVEVLNKINNLERKNEIGIS